MAQQAGRSQERAGVVDAPEPEEEEEDGGDAGSLEVDGKELDLADQEVEDLRAQVLQLLEELEETRELAMKHEDDSLELQGLLEDERLASAQQAEIFTKQIQRLQAQMRTLKDEFSVLQESKVSELEQVEQELLEANEELHSLRLAAEETAAIHENEIAALQEQLCRLRAELQRAQQIRDEYELETSTLRAEIMMKSKSQGGANQVVKLQEELLSLRERYRELTEEYQTLQESNKVLVHQLENLEVQKYKAKSKSEESHKSVESDVVYPLARRTPSPQRGSPRLSGSVSFKTVNNMGTASCKKESQRQDEESELSLRFQLRSEEEKVQLVQSKCDNTQSELWELQQQYLAIQKEHQQLQEELRLCRAEIQRLKGTVPADVRSRPAPDAPVISLPLIGLVVLVALLWCWWAETSS
uniref:Coiled-coil domain containing 136 n=1 Tax=Pelusios castaneus TaxID=367368 RepID=A0A8C8SLW9_9SAUR